MTDPADTSDTPPRLPPGRGRPIAPATPLARILIDRNLKRYDLCYHAKISDRVLGDYITGIKPVIPLAHLLKICAALDVTPEDLGQEPPEILGQPINITKAMNDSPSEARKRNKKQRQEDERKAK